MQQNKIQAKHIKGANGYKTTWVEHYGVTSLRRTVHKIEVKSAKFEKGAE
jgi:hypothetical protein